MIFLRSTSNNPIPFKEFKAESADYDENKIIEEVDKTLKGSVEKVVEGVKGKVEDAKKNLKTGLDNLSKGSTSEISK